MCTWLWLWGMPSLVAVWRLQMQLTCAARCSAVQAALLLRAGSGYRLQQWAATGHEAWPAQGLHCVLCVLNTFAR